MCTFCFSLYWPPICQPCIAVHMVISIEGLYWVFWIYRAKQGKKTKTKAVGGQSCQSGPTATYLVYCRLGRKRVGGRGGDWQLDLLVSRSSVFELWLGREAIELMEQLASLGNYQLRLCFPARSRTEEIEGIWSFLLHFEFRRYSFLCVAKAIYLTMVLVIHYLANSVR